MASDARAVTDAEELSAPQAKASGVAIAYALFGGILAWMAHLIGMAALVGYACDTGELWPMHTITAVTGLMAAHALSVGWRIARADDPSPNIQAAKLLGWLAVVFNVFNVVIIIAEWVPVLYLSPCAGG